LRQKLKRRTFVTIKTDCVDFVVATSEINRYGFRLDLNGAKLTGFLKNPVLLYGHDRTRLPIGSWENLRIEGGKMVATAVFDDEDSFAQQVKGKVERGILRGASIAFDPLMFSEKPEDLAPGQSRATVKEWELLEISVVDIPGDREAVRLSADRAIEEVVPQLSAVIQDNIVLKQPKDKMEKVTKALGLAADATEEQMVSAIESIQQNAVASLLAVGQSKGVVNESNRAQYERLAKADFEAVQLLFSSSAQKPAADAPAKQEQELTLTDLIKQLAASQTPATDDREQWSFDDWSKKDSEGLLKMKRQEPERYIQLATAYAKASNVIMD